MPDVPPRYLFASILFAAACNASSPLPQDAPGTYNYDFSCASNPMPTMAPAQIAVTGAVAQIFLNGGAAALQRTPGATVAACGPMLPSTCTESFNYTATTTGGDGTWGFPQVPTGGMPFDVWLFVSKVGNRPTFLWPSSPLYSDVMGVPVPVMEDEFLDDLGKLGFQQDPGKALVGVNLNDCKGQPILDTNNVKITMTKAGKPVDHGVVVDAHQFADIFAGAFFILNVQPGPIEVGATYKGQTMKAHGIIAYAGMTTETQLLPGYILGP